jgi:hypothetical protein
MTDHRPITTPQYSDLLTDTRRLLAEAVLRVRFLGAYEEDLRMSSRPDSPDRKRGPTS